MESGNYIVIAFVFVFFIGLIGFYLLFDYNWIQAFYSAVTVATTVDSPDSDVETDEQRMFVAIYAFMATILFIGLAGYLVYIISRRKDMNYA